jgi:hypothetical protein
MAVQTRHHANQPELLLTSVGRNGSAEFAKIPGE